jgi:hypothetical protein
VEVALAEPAAVLRRERGGDDRDDLRTVRSPAVADDVPAEAVADLPVEPDELAGERPGGGRTAGFDEGAQLGDEGGGGQRKGGHAAAPAQAAGGGETVHACVHNLRREGKVMRVGSFEVGGIFARRRVVVESDEGGRVGLGQSLRQSFTSGPIEASRSRRSTRCRRPDRRPPRCSARQHGPRRNPSPGRVLARARGAPAPGRDRARAGRRGRARGRGDS